VDAVDAAEFICVTWLIHTRDMTHSFVWNMCRVGHRVWTQLMQQNSCVWHDSFICATWLIQMCDICEEWDIVCWRSRIYVLTQQESYVSHDSFTRVAWLIHICGICEEWDIVCWRSRFHVCHMTHSHAWHDSFICVTYVQSGTSFVDAAEVMCWRSKNHVSHDSFTRVTWLIQMCGICEEWDMVCWRGWCSRNAHVDGAYVDAADFEHVRHVHDARVDAADLAHHTMYMGWLRSVGSIKLQVSFAEYRLFYRALLQKRPVI